MFRSGLFILAAVILLGGCGGGQAPPEKKAKSAPAEEAADKHFKGVGVVESVDLESGAVTIAHEDIPDFMNAMTMPFDVRDVSLLDGIEPGAGVSFDIVVQPDGRYYIDSIGPKE